MEKWENIQQKAKIIYHAGILEITHRENNWSLDHWRPSPAFTSRNSTGQIRSPGDAEPKEYDLDMLGHFISGLTNIILLGN